MRVDVQRPTVFPAVLPTLAWPQVRSCCVLTICVLVVAGCAMAPVSEAPPTPPAKPTAPPLPANAEPPPPSINLSGFPLPYRQGYADGCSSATGPERKDAVRFGADGNYRTGWQDGLALCRKK